jgi:predicted ATP-grasp superfamily ATP-dependent carboligase
MKIAVYSSCGNGAESAFLAAYRFIPDRASLWDEISEMFPEHEFKVYVGLQGGTTIDEDGVTILKKAKNVPYTLIPLNYGVEEIADFIAKDSPDVAVAFSTPSLPYDWGPVRDSLVAEALRAKGIRTIAHSPRLSEEAFEKHKINERLRNLGFKVPNGVYVNKKLFDSCYENAGIVRNAYRDYIRYSILNLKFPVVIKNNSGAGTVGLLVARTIDEAISILDSDKSGQDKIVEERVLGINFGAEVYGADGDYSVKGPVIFSSDEDGITDSFVSVKFGPVRNEKFKITELKETLFRMAKELGVCGCIQVDLIFSEGTWYIIEINPRFSFMSMLIAASDKKNMFLNFIEPALGKINDVDSLEQVFAIDFKTKVYDEAPIADVCRDFDSINTALRFTLSSTDGEACKDTEMTMGGFSKSSELIENLKEINKKYPLIATDEVVKNIVALIEYAERETL